jgi:hypothetical protein
MQRPLSDSLANHLRLIKCNAADAVMHIFTAVLNAPMLNGVL